MNSNDLPEFEPAAFWQEPDFILTELVSLMANRMNVELGITLMVGGAIITGSLIGEREYLRQVARLFRDLSRDMLDRPSAEDLAEIDQAFAFEEMAEDAYPDETAAAPEQPPLLPPLRFLHLRDPVMVSPGATMSFRDSALPVLRIRLSRIEGWMPGRVTTLTSDEYSLYDDDDDNATRYRPNGFIQ